MNLLQDIRYALRGLLKNPAFTTVAVLTLSLGIGANAAIFSLIDAILLKSLPVKQPSELVEIGRNSATSFSYPVFQRFRDSNHAFAGVLTVSKTALRTTGSEDVSEGQFVSGNFFSLLGINAHLGRVINDADDRIEDGNAAVAVISHNLWQRRFGSDRAVVGNVIAVEDKPFTIIGVSPPEFFGMQVGSAPDFWVPMAAEPLIRPKSWLPQPDFNWLSVVGRLKPGVSPEQARADLQSIFSQMLSERAPQFMDEHSRQSFLSQKVVVFSASNGLSRLRQQFSSPLLIVMGIVVAVLLIACANIANLLLARAAARNREFAIRRALGAGRFRLLRQTLTESLLLSIFGGAIGLILGMWGSSFLVRFMSSGNWPLRLQIEPDARMLLFTLGACLLVAVLCGIVPAVRATSSDLSPILKTTAHPVRHARGRLSVGKFLVVSQVASSLVLLIGAALFVGSLRNLKTLDAGFERENVLLISVNPGKSGYKDARLREFYLQLLERTNVTAGVVSTSLSVFTPISGSSVDLPAKVDGYVPQPNENTSVLVNYVSPNYFQTLRTPLLAGRDFNQQDTLGNTNVAVISETTMKHFFAGATPLGRLLRLGKDPVEIIGVVKDAKFLSLRESVQGTVYLNCLQMNNVGGSLTLAARTIGDPAAVASSLRREISSISSSVPVSVTGTLSDQVDRSLIQERLVATLSGFFAVLALLLACVGLYGVMSYNVVRRTSEIGIRMALGAQRGDVIRMVLRESLALVVLGVVIGIPFTLGATRLASSQISGLLFGLSATDLRIMGFAVLLLGVVTTLAACLPARRATRVDPLIALRAE